LKYSPAKIESIDCSTAGGKILAVAHALERRIHKPRK
jgi:hypothetical protein